MDLIGELKKKQKKKKKYSLNNFFEKNFFKYQAQTTNHPLALEISHAQGSYIYDNKNQKYLDFVSGVSASNLGHRNKIVSNAVKKQLTNIGM